nr:restriction endonuclease [Paenibacillus camelliae]
MGLLVLGAGLGIWQLTNNLIIAALAAGCVVGLFFAVAMILHMKKVERLKRSGIAEIDKMEGRQFEKYLGHLFRMHGYAAEVTQASGDYGADLVISKGGRRIVVQAKRYKNNVGLKAVQEIYAAMNHYKASEAWVVTNSDFTEQAYTLARSNGVKLINRNQLIEMILAVNPPNNASAKKKTI